MNNASSSHKKKLDHFHMKGSYIVKLSSFMYKMNFRRLYSIINIHDLLKTIGASPILMEKFKP
jgi:hypothetical protein